AVLALRDLALEAPVLERVILDVDRERSDAVLERHALRNSPGGEHAVALEAEVVMEPARVMALDDERRPVRGSPASAERLGGLRRMPLLAVLLEAHEAFLARRRRVRSTDSRSACMRSTTSASSSAGSGSGIPSAFAWMSSSSSRR